MSQSPQDVENRAELEGYKAGWAALNKLLSTGSSFSGHERNCVYLNCGHGQESTDVTFADVSAVSGVDFPDDGRAVAVMDWDHDGDLDLWLRNRTAPRLRLLLNQTSGESAANFVTFKLVGTTCNRDAVGARVEVVLTPEDRSKKDVSRSMASLRAGEGYLSQSSKWLHFGLVRGHSIKEVVVHWPQAAKETFTGCAAGNHYLLTQGSGRASVWVRPGTKPVLAAKALSLASSSGKAQVILPRRIPAPAIDYVSIDGKTKRIERGKRPLYLLFFASWCPHCQTELKELAESHAKIQAAGVDVLALIVDHLADEISDTDVSAVLKQSQFPFVSGQATDRGLAQIQHLEHGLFELHVPFAVPYSCLLDTDRNLVAMYRGPVPLDVLLYDVRHLSATQQQLRDMSIPFPGRWYTEHPTETVLLELLADHFQQPFPDQTLRYLKQAISQLKEDSKRETVKRRIAAIHYQLGVEAFDADKLSAAEEHYRQVVEFDPDHAAAHTNLGVIHVRRGEFEQAETQFQRALELQPYNEKIKSNLRNLRAQMKQN